MNTDYSLPAEYTRKEKQQIRKDRQRIFRVVEHFDFPNIIESSPVQVNDGYVISDTETNELFACFNFQSFSEKQIHRFIIRLLLYRDMDNVPYMKVPYIYSYENLSLGIRNMPGEENKKYKNKKIPKYIRPTEYFGNASYIKLPESYFKKIKLEILGAEYTDGTSESFSIIVNNKVKHFNEFDDEKQYAFSKLNIYSEAEQYFPTRLVPEASDNAWLCCCGNKNMITETKCSLCGRDKDWQLNNLKESKLEETVTILKQNNDNMLKDRSHFKSYERELTDEEAQQKIKEYEKVLQNIAEDERRREHRNKMIIPKIILYFAVFALIIYLLEQLLNL